VVGSFFAAVVLIAAAINFWGAAELRQNGGELAFVTIVGAATIVVATSLSAWLNISFSLDVLGRQNPAALVSICAVLISAGAIYSGSSLGEGPSYSNNFFCMMLGFSAFFGLWLLLEFATSVSRSISEEGDLASGIRFGSWLLSVALVLGRALAGDWHSEQQTLRDFIREGWPAVLLCGLAMMSEMMLRPKAKSLFPKWQIQGLVPAFVYFGLALAWLWRLGPWEGMRK
jgi:hypothetical protein